MSKKEFVDAYAKATGETKKRAEELVNQFLDTVEESLLKGDSVQFVGWGTFEVKERANRRYKELVSKVENVKIEEIYENILKRDKIDSTRKESPLKKADDAIEVDTTSKNIEEVKNEILYIIKQKNKI